MWVGVGVMNGKKGEKEGEEGFNSLVVFLFWNLGRGGRAGRS